MPAAPRLELMPPPATPIGVAVEDVPKLPAVEPVLSRVKSIPGVIQGAKKERVAVTPVEAIPVVVVGVVVTPVPVVTGVVVPVVPTAASAFPGEPESDIPSE